MEPQCMLSTILHATLDHVFAIVVAIQFPAERLNPRLTPSRRILDAFTILSGHSYSYSSIIYKYSIFKQVGGSEKR